MADEARDKQVQGSQRSLAGGFGGAYQLNYNNPNARAGIVTGTGADWFGPLNPMQPIAPADVKGRVHDYPSGYNLNIQPRAYSAISFEALRNFAEFYDLLRLLIETRKDQMGRQRWNIVPRDGKLRKSVTAEMQTRITAVEAFFLRPDGKHFWNEWLRMLLEDLLVLDAPTLYKQRTFGGKLYRLVPIDGGTIKRVIDDWAETPEPPCPAYQQVLKGYPAVDYTTDEIMYRPRNKRTHRIYGYGPVEQIIMTIQIGLRREIWQLQSFTEGNIPEALIGTPSTWTPDQIRNFQTWFDSILEGQTAERRRARFVPGEIAKGYVATKPDELFGAAEEWLARVMCFAFGVSPQPFVKMMNRATAESAQEAAAEEGLAPLQEWVKGMMDELLIDEFDSPDLEFEYLDEDELDPKIKSDIIVAEFTKSLLSLNEARGEMGLDPIPDCPEADRPMLLTTAGWVPFALTQQEKDEQEASAQEQLKAMQAKPPGGSGEDGGSGEQSGKDAGEPGANDQGNGEVAEKGDVPFPVSHHGPKCGCVHRALLKAGGAGGSKTHPLDPLRPSIAKIEKKFSTATAAMLSRLGRSVAKQVKAYPAGKVQKADDAERKRILQERLNDTEDWSDIDLEDLIGALDLSVLEGFDEDAASYMEKAFLDAARMSVAHVGATANLDDEVMERLVNVVNDRAVNWAKDNAGELVSDDGLLDTTRDMIRSTIVDGMEQNLSRFEIGDALEESYGFSEDRAQLIAATEITSANSMGALAGYEESKDAGVSVKKSWLVLEDGCDICQGNADAGAIDLDEEFPSGDLAPGAHPNCRCVLIPEVEGEDDGTAEAEVEGMEQAAKPEFVKNVTTAPDYAFPPDGGRVSTDTDEDEEILIDPNPAPASPTFPTVGKRDNRDNMEDYFEVDTDGRGSIWARGGNNEEAKAERESSLLQFVPFDQCIATQDYCDHDKVQLYTDDPTAKGFAPMAYFDGLHYYIQDGHHRAVASRLAGNRGMSMNVKSLKNTGTD